jgi:threonine aldolase
MSSSDSKKQTRLTLHGHLPEHNSDVLRSIASWLDKCDPESSGADVYGQGKIMQAFEAKIATLLGFESAVFMPSGTMAQQIALRTAVENDSKTQRKVGLHATSHLLVHEHRGFEHLHQLEAVKVGAPDSIIRAADIEEACQTHLSCIVAELPARENGGQLPTWDELVQLKKTVKSKGVHFHMDGARLWGCRSYYGNREYKDICAGFDSVYTSYYKGVNGFAGAVLAGTSKFCNETRIWLRRHGGNIYTQHPYVSLAAMRFDQRISRFPEYFARATEIAEAFHAIDGVKVVPFPVQHNMFHVHFANVNAAQVNAALDEANASSHLFIRHARPLPSYNCPTDAGAAAKRALAYMEFYVAEAACHADVNVSEFASMLSAVIEKASVSAATQTDTVSITEQ